MVNKSETNVGTYFSLVLTTFCWAGTFIAGRLLSGVVPPASAAFFRFAIATVALLLLVYLREGRPAIPPRRIWPALLLLGLTGVFSYNMLFFTGLQYIGAGRASLIIALNPLAITLGAALFLREALTVKKLAGILISLAGALFVIGDGHPDAVFSGGFGNGEIAILGCVVSWAAYSLVGRTVLKTLSPLSSVFYSSLIGTLLLSVPSFLEGGISDIFSYSVREWGNFAFLGIFGTALGFSLYYRAIRLIGPIRSGVFINLVPFFSILLSWFVLDETISAAALAGGGLLLTGVTLTNLATVSKSEPPSAAGKSLVADLGQSSGGGIK